MHLNLEVRRPIFATSTVIWPTWIFGT